MSGYDVDAVVIGAGVVGLAIARALSLAGLSPMIFEKNPRFGEETSARNSEVIHAGIYYDAGSLKARHCVEGKARLYDFCAARGVPHQRCEKLIVASGTDEVARLDGIMERARVNGVSDLCPLDRREALHLEPALEVAGALRSPSTGIIDSHALMQAYLGEAEAHGAELVENARVTGGALRSDGRIELVVNDTPEAKFVTGHMVNAAGLWAQDVTTRIEGLPAPPPGTLVKGNYFSLGGRTPFSRLIYPVPSDGGLGVHLTLDLAGRGKFGPDTEWLSGNDPSGIDYCVDATRSDTFYAAIRRYWPALPDNALAADYSGVRPKLAGSAYPDFRVDGAEAHGAPGHVLLYGIESPGLTASLSLAEAVAQECLAYS